MSVSLQSTSGVFWRANAILDSNSGEASGRVGKREKASQGVGVRLDFTFSNPLDDREQIPILARPRKTPTLQEGCKTKSQNHQILLQLLLESNVLLLTSCYSTHKVLAQLQETIQH